MPAEQLFVFQGVSQSKLFIVAGLMRFLRGRFSCIMRKKRVLSLVTTRFKRESKLTVMTCYSDVFIPRRVHPMKMGVDLL